MLFCRVLDGAPGTWGGEEYYPILSVHRDSGCWHLLMVDDDGIYQDLTPRHVRDCTQEVMQKEQERRKEAALAQGLIAKPSLRIEPKGGH